MIKKGLEKSSPFLCGKLDMLADWRKIWQAEKSAENLADPVKRKIWCTVFCGKINVNLFGKFAKIACIIY